MFLSLNGYALLAKNALISVFDNGLLYGDGCYESLRVYDGIPFEVSAHIQRLEHSLGIIGIPLPLTSTKIEHIVRTLIKKNSLRNGIVRLTVTRGAHGFEFISKPKHPTLLIHCERLVIDPTMYTKGISVSTMRMQRLLPQVKMLGLTSQIVAYREAQKTQDYEKIFIGQKNEVLEGASTNVFLVRRGTLITPSRHILKGLTRNRVIALARKAKIPVQVRRVSLGELKHADEIFLTNRPREIIPVVKINGERVGVGRPGVVTKKMMQLYGEYVKKKLE